MTLVLSASIKNVETSQSYSQFKAGTQFKYERNGYLLRS